MVTSGIEVDVVDAQGGGIVGSMGSGIETTVPPDAVPTSVATLGNVAATAAARASGVSPAASDRSTRGSVRAVAHTEHAVR